MLTRSRFAAINLDHKSKIPGYPDLVQTLENDDAKRSDFLVACLLKLGLKIDLEDKEVPSLSHLHLSSAVPSDISNLMDSLKGVITLRDGEEYLKDENDTFHFEQYSAWRCSPLIETLSSIGGETSDRADTTNNRDIDFDSAVKHVVVHDRTPPAEEETPFFNHAAYYGDLENYRSKKDKDDAAFGQCLLYGKVVTSTNTILEKYA